MDDSKLGFGGAETMFKEFGVSLSDPGSDIFVIVVDRPHVRQKLRLQRVDEMLAPHFFEGRQIIAVLRVHPLNHLKDGKKIQTGTFFDRLA